MTVYFDPTEERSTSRIQEVLSAVGKPLKGLERATAADIAILPDDFPVADDCLSFHDSEDVGRVLWSLDKKAIAEQFQISLPLTIKLVRFFQSSHMGMLVQRKSGGDLLGSIPDLSRILEKMRVWNMNPWLMTAGNYTYNSDGTLSVNGRGSEYAYAAYLGALEAWQRRGGFYINLSDDSMLVMRNWLLRQQKWVNDSYNGLVSNKVVQYRRPPQQFLVNETDESAWITTLMTFRGVGPTLAKNIGDFFGTLAGGLCFISDPTSPKWKDKPEGFGPTLSKYARDRLGLVGTQRLQIVDDEE